MIPNEDFLAFTRQQQEVFPFSWRLPAGAQVSVWDNGILCIEPPWQGEPEGLKHIILSCAIHGNETAPIELANQLLQRILQGKLDPLHRLLFIFGNPLAMLLGVREVDFNLNRLFSRSLWQGQPLAQADDLYEEMRAQQIGHAIVRFFACTQLGERLHYDLHTAIKGSHYPRFAVYPHLTGRHYNLPQIQFLAQCGVQTWLLSASATTILSYYCSEYCQAHAFTVEQLGKANAFGENDLSQLADVELGLQNLVSL